MHYADQLTGAYEEDLTRASGGVSSVDSPPQGDCGQECRLHTDLTPYA